MPQAKTANLGVLVDPYQLAGALIGRYGYEYLPFYAEAAAKVDTSVVFFTPELVHGDGLVQAYRYNTATGGFRSDVYEVPPLVHNRILWRHQEHRYDDSAPCGLSDSVLYNRFTRFSKWDVQWSLKGQSATRPYLLHTTLLQSKEQLQNWLQSHQAVYLKPCNGSLGDGVLKLSHNRGKLVVAHMRKGEPHQSRGWYAPVLERALNRAKSQPVMVQEAAPVIQVDGRPVDFRVTVQRGDEGGWCVAGVVARVGVRRSHVTNMALGGIPVPALPVLELVYGSRAGIWLDRLEEAGLRIAQGLQSLDQEVADIGLDIALTEQGQVRFIEANGRDLRITFRDANQHTMWRNTFQNPMLYGQYLLSTGGYGCDKSTMDVC